MRTDKLRFNSPKSESRREGKRGENRIQFSKVNLTTNNSTTFIRNMAFRLSKTKFESKCSFISPVIAFAKKRCSCIFVGIVNRIFRCFIQSSTENRALVTFFQLFHLQSDSSAVLF